MSIAESAFDSMVGRIKYYFQTHGYKKPMKIYNNLGVAVNDHTEEDSDEVISALYGVYRQQSSQVSAMTDSLHMVTGSAILELLVDAMPAEDGTFPDVDLIDGLLHDCSNDITGDWYETVTDGANGSFTSCAVFPVVSLPTVGMYQEASSNWGAFVPVSVQLYFTAVQGAMPPSGVKLAIDGVEIPTIELVLGRTKAATSDVKSTSVNGSTENSEESSTFEVQFSTPAHYFTASGIIEELLTGAPNVPHCVQIGISHTSIQGAPTWTNTYLMSIAKSQLTKNAGATVGINCNLLELAPEAAQIKDADRWKKSNVTATDGLGYLLVKDAVWCIFWGDGTSQVVDATGGVEDIEHQYPADGVYTVIRYKVME